MRIEDCEMIEKVIGKVSRKLTIHKIAGITIMTCSIVCMLIIAYLAYFPVKVIDIKYNLVIVDVNGHVVDIVKPGDRLFYKLHYRKYRNIPSRLTVYLTNKYQMIFPSFTVNFPVTDEEKLKDPEYYDTAIIQLDLPKTTTDGTHYITGTLSYWVNPLRLVNYSFTTMKFEVLGNGCSETENEPAVKIYKENNR